MERAISMDSCQLKPNCDVGNVTHESYCVAHHLISISTLFLSAPLQEGSGMQSRIESAGCTSIDVDRRHIAGINRVRNRDKKSDL